MVGEEGEKQSIKKKKKKKADMKTLEFQLVKTRQTTKQQDTGTVSPLPASAPRPGLGPCHWTTKIKIGGASETRRQRSPKHRHFGVQLRHCGSPSSLPGSFSLREAAAKNKIRKKTKGKLGKGAHPTLSLGVKRSLGILSLETP